MRKHTIALAITAALGAISFSSAQAASWKAGDWDLGLSGNVNTFYTATTCKSGNLTSTKAGNLTLAGLACGGDVGNSQTISNGLLPAALNFSAKTNQDGYDVSGNINVYYGTTTQDGSNPAGTPAGDALDFSTVDARQIYLTFGNEKMGTVKAGRDFGLFGFDSIINDMSLPGTGAMVGAAKFGHTTLGGLGYGYVYTDRLSQINWTTPKKNGFEATVGVFNPLHGLDDVGATQNAGQVGVHGKASYSWDKGNGVKGTVSTSGLSQKVKLNSGKTTDMQGVDVFGKVDVNKASFAASAFQGKGMDTLGLGGFLYPGFNSVSGKAEKVKGYMAQATYTVNKTKYGVNYSQSKQTELNKVKNDRVTLGAYHNLTKNLTLIGEASNQKGSTNAGTDKTNSVSLGAMFSF